MPKRMQLTVVLRDDSPMHFEDPPTHRTVVLLLTDEQNRKLQLREIGQSMGRPMYEKFSYCILEEVADV